MYHSVIANAKDPRIITQDFEINLKIFPVKAQLLDADVVEFSREQRGTCGLGFDPVFIPYEIPYKI